MGFDRQPLLPYSRERLRRGMLTLRSQGLSPFICVAYSLKYGIEESLVDLSEKVRHRGFDQALEIVFRYGHCGCLMLPWQASYASKSTSSCEWPSRESQWLSGWAYERWLYLVVPFDLADLLDSDAVVGTICSCPHSLTETLAECERHQEVARGFPMPFQRYCIKYRWLS